MLFRTLNGVPEFVSSISENCCRNSHPHQIYHLVVRIQVGQTFQHTQWSMWSWNAETMYSFIWIYSYLLDFVEIDRCVKLYIYPQNLAPKKPEVLRMRL